jgi:hypothetical protein
MYVHTSTSEVGFKTDGDILETIRARLLLMAEQWGEVDHCVIIKWD